MFSDIFLRFVVKVSSKVELKEVVCFLSIANSDIFI